MSSQESSARAGSSNALGVCRGGLSLAALALLAALAGCGGEPGAPEHPGKAVYLRYCFSCHQAGIAGAPKLGEREDWTARLAQGREAMLANVKAGMTPGMPPRGACAGCDDETLAAAVDYMIGELGEAG